LNRYFQMVLWFIAFVICIGIPPLFIVFVIAILVKFGGVLNHFKYQRQLRDLRNSDIPPRGYQSGDALRNNRRSQ